MGFPEDVEVYQPRWLRLNTLVCFGYRTTALLYLLSEFVFVLVLTKWIFWDFTLFYQNSTLFDITDDLGLMTTKFCFSINESFYNETHSLTHEVHFHLLVWVWAWVAMWEIVLLFFATIHLLSISVKLWKRKSLKVSWIAFSLIIVAQVFAVYAPQVAETMGWITGYLENAEYYTEAAKFGWFRPFHSNFCFAVLIIYQLAAAHSILRLQRQLSNEHDSDGLELVSIEDSFCLTKITGKMHIGKDPYERSVQDPCATKFLKLKTEISANGCRIYEDFDFPPATSSVGLEISGLEWTRLKDIVDSPKFFDSSSQPFSISQGKIKGCMLLPALMAFHGYRTILERACPADNGVKGIGVEGLFHFWFYKKAKWQEIYIDDKLPCIGKIPFSLRDDKGKQFWSCLLEKALAKLLGTYAQLVNGKSPGYFIKILTGVNPDKLSPRSKFFPRSRLSTLESIKDSLAANIPVCFSAPTNGKYFGLGFTACSFAVIRMGRVNVPCLEVQNAFGNRSVWTHDSENKLHPLHEMSWQSSIAFLQYALETESKFYVPFDIVYDNFYLLEFCKIRKSTVNTILASRKKIA